MSDFKLVMTPTSRTAPLDPGTVRVPVRGTGFLARTLYYAVRPSRLVRLPTVLLPLQFSGSRSGALEYELCVRVARGREDVFAKALHVEQNPTADAAEYHLRHLVVQRLAEIANDSLDQLSAQTATGFDFTDLKTMIGADVLTVGFPMPTLSGGDLVTVPRFGMLLASAGRGVSYPVDFTFTCDMVAARRVVAGLRRFDAAQARNLAELRLPKLFANQVQPAMLRPDKRTDLEALVRAELDAVFLEHGRVVRTLSVDPGRVPEESVSISFTKQNPFRWAEREDSTRLLAIEAQCHLSLTDPARYAHEKSPPLRPWLEAQLRKVLDEDLREVKDVRLDNGDTVTLPDGLTREEILTCDKGLVQDLIRQRISVRANRIGYEAKTFLVTPDHEVLELARQRRSISIDVHPYRLHRPSNGADIRGNVGAIVTLQPSARYVVRHYLDAPGKFEADIRSATQAALRNSLAKTTPQDFYLKFGSMVQEPCEKAVQAAILDMIGKAADRVDVQGDRAALESFVERFRGHQTTFSLTLNAPLGAENIDSFSLEVSLEIGDPASDDENWPVFIEAMGSNPDAAKDTTVLQRLDKEIETVVARYLHEEDFDSIAGLTVSNAEANKLLSVVIDGAARGVVLRRLGMQISNLHFARGATGSHVVQMATAAARTQVGLNNIQLQLKRQEDAIEANLAATAKRHADYIESQEERGNRMTREEHEAQLTANVFGKPAQRRLPPPPPAKPDQQ